MPAEKATALVLRLVDWSETSSVVTLFTREFGKVRGLAKGGRRPKGPFESALDLLSVCRIVFLRKSSEALDLLTEAKLEWRFRPRGRDLPSLYAAYYVAELLGKLTDDYDPHPPLFDAAEQTLRELSGGGSVTAVVLRFELVLLGILGHLPSLGRCVQCGTEVPHAGRVAFGPVAGGVFCAACRAGKIPVVSLRGETLQALTVFADRQDQLWREYPLDRPLVGELRGAMNQYISHLLGHEPNLQAYLKLLSL